MVGVTFRCSRETDVITLSRSHQRDRDGNKRIYKREVLSSIKTRIRYVN